MTLPDPLAAFHGWLALRDLDEPALRERLKIGAHQVHPGLSFLGNPGLTALVNLELLPGPLFLRDGRFFVLSISQPSPALAAFTPQMLLEDLGEPEAILRSRAGRFCREHVYPAEGVSFSADETEVNFIQIFQPTTLKQYRRYFYIEPDEFIR